mgnify:FL=1
MKRLLPFFILILFCNPLHASAAESPERIVSLSLCSDELLLRLADRDRIASLSYLSADPDFSAISNELSGIHLNRGRAEEVVLLDPDLVLSSQFSASSALNLLQQLGYSISTLGFPTSLQETYAQIRELGLQLEEEERAEMLINEMRDQVEAIRLELDARNNLSAVFYSNNGFSFGRHTLRDSFLQSLGINNVAADYGIVSFGKLPLEVLIEAKPDFLLVDASSLHQNRLAHPLLNHPVLQAYFGEENIIVLPDKYFQCAGPSLLNAYRLLIDAIGKEQ